MKLSDIYQAMKTRKLVASRAAFSSDWLGALPDHFSNKYDKISLRSRVYLYIKLRDAGVTDLADEVYILLRSSANL